MSRHELRWWLLIGLAALLVRAGYAREFASADSLAFHAPVQTEDSWLYWQQSLALAVGEGMGRHPLHEGPAYGMFLALLRLAGLHAAAAFYAVQAILGSIACVLTGLAGSALYGRRVGLLAAALAAVYAPLVFHTVLLMAEALVIPLYALLLWLLAARLARPGGAVAAGIVTGVLALVRASNLLLVPLLLPVLWHEHRRQAARFALAALTVTGLLTARNYLASDDPVLLTSNGGVAFWMGNSPSAPGWYADPAPSARAAAVFARGLPYAAQGRALLRATLADIADAPGKWLHLLLRKAWLAVFPYEVSTQGDYPARRAAGRLLGLLPDARVLFPLAAAGLLLLDRRRALVLLPLLAVPLLTCILMFVTSRYRLPLVLPACVLAGAAIAAGTARAAGWRQRMLLLLVAGATALLLTVAVPPLAPVLATDARVAGEHFFRRGEHATALTWFRVSAKHELQAGTAARLGDLAVMAGDTAAAAWWYDAAVDGFARAGELRLRDAYRARRDALRRP